MSNRIPKVIHYCWVGNSEKPQSVINTIESWKLKLEGYRIIEWNEQNFHLQDCCVYVKDAYAAGKWAFVTDFMRLKVLYEYGGIYLDTDVEVLKNFDPLLTETSFVCSESKYSICSAVIGTCPKVPWVKEILEQYENRRFFDEFGKTDTTPNSLFLFEYFKKKYNYTQSCDHAMRYDICTIYPSEYFSPINYNTMKCTITTNTFAIHHYNGAWKGSGSKLKARILAFVTCIIGEDKREELKKFIKHNR